MAKRKQKTIKANDGLEYQEILIAKIALNEEAKNPNNAYFRSANTGKGFKGMFMKADYKAYKQKLIDLAKSIVGGDFTPYDGPVKIVSHWTFGTLRKKDVQNCGKLEYDAFNGIIYEDDSQIIEDHRFKHYKKNEPSILIEIYGYKEIQEE
jgi:Holliday junction resolvase RusA-like endonuclease